MDSDILSMKIGSKKVTALIKDVTLIQVLRPKNNKVEQKIVFTVVDTATNVNYKVSDAWTEYKNKLTIRALWLYESPDGIYANSTLAKIMSYYKADTLKDMIGKTVELYPDSNNYLTLVGTTLL